MDRYIDNNETQVYGPKLSANIRRKFTEMGPVQALMLHCCTQLDAATETMRVAMVGERNAGSVRSALAEEKLPAVAAARSELKTFSLMLTAHKSDEKQPWNGDPNLFVPGGIGAVGKGARALKVATETARAQLEADLHVPGRAGWIERLDAQLESLGPLVDRTDGVTKAHHDALSEQSSEKKAWLRAYRGACLIVEGVLTSLGRESEYASMVPHLNARGSRKLT